MGEEGWGHSITLPPVKLTMCELRSTSCCRFTPSRPCSHTGHVKAPPGQPSLPHPCHQAMLRSNAPSLVPKTCVPFIPVETAPRVVLRAFWQSKAETDWIASSIAAQHEAGLAYSDMAVLVRTQASKPRSPAGRARAS